MDMSPTSALKQVRQFWKSKPRQVAMSDRNDENWRECRCVFGLSTGRCGTTTLEKLFNLSPEIRAYHEPPPAVSDPSRAEPFYSFPAHRELLTRAFIEFRSKTLQTHHNSSLTYVEVNGLKFHAPIISDLLPSATFFFLHRHPLAFITSGMRRGWYSNHPRDATRLVPTPSQEAFSKWQNWDRFAKICWLWNATNTYLLNCLHNVPQERYEIFRFSDLMNPDTRQWEKLFSLAGVPKPSDSQVSNVLSKRHNAQIGGMEFDPTGLTLSERELMLEIAGKMMDRLGYRLDEN